MKKKKRRQLDASRGDADEMASSEEDTLDQRRPMSGQNRGTQMGQGMHKAASPEKIRGVPMPGAQELKNNPQLSSTDCLKTTSSSMEPLHGHGGERKKQVTYDKLPSRQDPCGDEGPPKRKAGQYVTLNNSGESSSLSDTSKHEEGTGKKHVDKNGGTSIISIKPKPNPKPKDLDSKSKRKSGQYTQLSSDDFSSDSDFGEKKRRSYFDDVTMETFLGGNRSSSNLSTGSKQSDGSNLSTFREPQRPTPAGGKPPTATKPSNIPAGKIQNKNAEKQKPSNVQPAKPTDPQHGNKIPTVGAVLPRRRLQKGGPGYLEPEVVVLPRTSEEGADEAYGTMTSHLSTTNGSTAGSDNGTLSSNSSVVTVVAADEVKTRDRLAAQGKRDSPKTNTKQDGNDSGYNSGKSLGSGVKPVLSGDKRSMSGDQKGPAGGGRTKGHAGKK